MLARHKFENVAMPARSIWLGLVLSAVGMLTGCASSGGGATTTTTTGGSTTTPDFGTLTMVGTTYQYQIKNAASGLVLGISGQSQTANTNLVQETNTSSTDSMWHFMPNVYASDEFNIENMLTHQVIGISNAATAAGAQAVQFNDSGTDDQNWQFYLLSDGNYLIKDHNSGLYLENANSNTTSSATIDQGARATTGTACTCQEWTLTQTTTAAYPAPLTVTGTGIYVHDPFMLKDASGTYWLYGTHNTLAKSTDMTTFTSVSPDISPVPSWWSSIYLPSAGSPDMWAPSVLYANGTYYQYYAVPVEPDTVGGEAIIGLVTSTNPNGPWTDKGWLIQSWSNTVNTPPSGFGFVAGTTYNAIDPAPFIDTSGNWWLVWGSWFDGTHMIQLDPSTGLRLSSNTKIYNTANRFWGEEGPFIYYWNGYYYYFAPINPCCSSTSTYRIIVGRSTSPTGPYLDRGGQDLSNNGGTILLSTHGNIVGPGGQSVFTDGTTPTLVYHYYDGNNNGTPTLGINRLGFTSDGWPYVE